MLTSGASSASTVCGRRQGSTERRSVRTSTRGSVVLISASTLPAHGVFPATVRRRSATLLAPLLPAARGGGTSRRRRAVRRSRRGRRARRRLRGRRRGGRRCDDVVLREHVVLREIVARIDVFTVDRDV